MTAPRLTAENLKQLQPSLIRPMSPMSISSDEDDGAEDLATDERVARLKSWVYNAMLTLVGLGSEGRGVVEADELYVAGPGDIRLRGQGAAAEGDCSGGHDRDSTSCEGRQSQIQTTGLTRQDAGVPVRVVAGDTDVHADANAAVSPDLSDPAYWEAKLQYLESKCQPLCQERRKRRRLEPATRQKPDAALETAAACKEVAEEAEALQAERARIEESRLLWRDKQDAITAWIGKLPSIEPTRSPTPLAGSRPPRHEHEPAFPTAQDDVGYNHFASSSDSSIVEITSIQFTRAVGAGQQMAAGPVTACASTGEAQLAAETANVEVMCVTKREDREYLGVAHLRSPPESQGLPPVLGKRRRSMDM